MRHFVLALTFSTFVGFGTASAQTSGHRVEVSGSSVLLRVNTGPVQQTCSYAWVVTFTGGATEGANGTTDPVTNAQNHVAASRTYNRGVQSAQLTTWSCRPKG